MITGASKVTQVEENMKALPLAAKLTPDVLEKIEKVTSRRISLYHSDPVVQIVDNKPAPPRNFRNN